jgi:uncharacterized membrane protein
MGGWTDGRLTAGSGVRDTATAAAVATILGQCQRAAAAAAADVKGLQ